MILGYVAVQAQPPSTVRGAGAGTANTIPVWTDSSTIGNSIVSQTSGKSGGININVSGGVIATSLIGDGSGVTNVNAAKLGGVAASGFPQLGLSNIFTTGQTINGTLTLGGSINGTLTLLGPFDDGQGNRGADVIGGFSGDGSFPANSVGFNVTGATIAGGGGGQLGSSVANTVLAAWGTVGGGGGNTASGPHATVAGGLLNTASGERSMVAGGWQNVAGGEYSFAAGARARANGLGSFVWSAGNSNGLSDTGPGQFLADAPGGFTFYTSVSANPTTPPASGATLAAGSGTWASLSDRNAKANFGAVDGQDLLERLAAIPVSTWNYKTQPDEVRHMGPMAQDFRAAFGLGEDDTHISTVDSEGVALAAIQALYQTMTELKRDLSDKDQQITDLRARLARMEQRQ